MSEFSNYLRTFNAVIGEGFTHTRIGDKKTKDFKGKIWGGSYNIPDDKYEEFMEMYFNWVFVAGNDEYMTEKQLDKGPICIDLDFKYDNAITSRQHTSDHNIDIVMVYMEKINELLHITENSEINVYVMEKDKVNCLENKTKDGIHIIIGLNMELELRMELRDRVLNKSNIKNICGDLPLTNDWKDIIDDSISSGFANWQLIGSCKPEHQPYKLTQHLIVTYKNNYWECEEQKGKFDMKSHFFNLSIRNDDRPTFNIKEGELEKAIIKYNPQAKAKEAKVIDKKISIISTDLTEISGKPIEIYCKLGIKHEIFKKMWQVPNYKIWISIGFIVKNELGDNGEDLFIDLSREYDSYNEEEVRTCYKTLNKTNKNESKKPLTIASLIKYFKDTDKDIAKVIIKEALQTIKNQETPETPEESNVEFDESKLEYFDSDYCNSFCDDYLTQKKYFEKFVCKVLRPEPQFIYIEGKKDIGKDICIYCKTSILTAFEHITTDIVIGEKIIEAQFIKRWLQGKNQRCYNFLDFLPTNTIDVAEQKDNKIYNLFAGYNPKIKSEFNIEKKQIILKPFIDLAFELCGAVESYSSYFIKYLAHIIQFPAEKIPIAIIFKGKQGTGKTMLLNAFGNLIGRKHYISSSNAKDFFGDYAEGFYHKLLVNMNECEGKNTFDFEGKIKSFISEDRITINPKNVRPSEINNFARTIITTNKANPIPIDVKSGDRRFVVYQTSDKFLDKKYGTNFWLGLSAHFNKPEFIACLYDYLNTLDVSKVDWKNERPITEAYKQMCKLYVPIEALFFEDYINKHRGCMIDKEGNTTLGSNWEKEIKIKSKDIYDDYVCFCKSNGFSNDKRFVADIPHFNNRCEELEIPHRQIKSHGINEYRFTSKDIFDFLIKKKWINREIDDPEIVPIDEKGDDFVFET